MAKAEDKTVLVVDDEPDVRNYLSTLLRDAGFQVVTAPDGDEAMRIIREKKPDFISLDLVMPRKSGHRLLYELRKDRDLSRIPVLIITAHARDELGKGDLADLLANRILAGPGAYLEKPVRPMDYVRCVQRALGIEETAQVANKINLVEDLQNEMKNADVDALRQALEALKKKQ